jgi:hypothetical protein
VIRIVGFGGLMAIDLGCRGAVVGLSLLIAAVLLRDDRAGAAAMNVSKYNVPVN